MTYACLTYEPDARDSFVTVTMNRPEKLNALNGKLLDELMDAVGRAAADPAINAMILTGAGRAFTTGFDLNGDDFEMGVEGWRKDIQANCDRLMGRRARRGRGRRG